MSPGSAHGAEGSVSKWGRDHLIPQYRQLLGKGTGNHSLQEGGFPVNCYLFYFRGLDVSNRMRNVQAAKLSGNNGRMGLTGTGIGFIMQQTPGLKEQRGIGFEKLSRNFPNLLFCPMVQNGTVLA